MFDNKNVLRVLAVVFGAFAALGIVTFLLSLIVGDPYWRGLKEAGSPLLVAFLLLEKINALKEIEILEAQVRRRPIGRVLSAEVDEQGLKVTGQLFEGVVIPGDMTELSLGPFTRIDPNVNITGNPEAKIYLVEKDKDA